VKRFTGLRFTISNTFKRYVSGTAQVKRSKLVLGKNPTSIGLGRDQSPLDPIAFTGIENHWNGIIRCIFRAAPVIVPIVNFDVPDTSAVVGNIPNVGSCIPEDDRVARVIATNTKGHSISDVHELEPGVAGYLETIIIRITSVKRIGSFDGGARCRRGICRNVARRGVVDDEIGSDVEKRRHCWRC
jgi:hypothetical protein